jgi:hypothetical protein
MKVTIVIGFFLLLALFPIGSAMKVYPTPPPGALDNLPHGMPIPPLAINGENYIVIHDVPVFLWHHGCSPTSIGMILGYYDSVANTTYINNSNPYSSIASIEHYNDYSLPFDDCCFGCLIPDKSEINTSEAHQDNSIADFLHTSQSAFFCCYGATLTAFFVNGILEYNDYIGTNRTVTIQENYNVTYEYLKNEINNGRPVLLSVDSDSDGEEDHSVVAIGWNEIFNPPRIGIFTTWDTNIWWIEIHPPENGDSWGVGEAYTINLGSFDVNDTEEDNPYPIPGFEFPLLIFSFIIFMAVEYKIKKR